jgi:L-seryl-tRNA(Ser) seleniumtransferase
MVENSMKEKQELLRNLPSVDQLLKSDDIQGMLGSSPRMFVLAAVRKTLEQYREGIMTGKAQSVDPGSIIESVRGEVDRLSLLNLRPVINATGIVVHTNLGRAPLPKRVLENVVKIAEGYSNLEYDLAQGTRGKRYSHIKRIIKEITGAEDCLVVNNNAAAVLLCLTALARGREVIVSRGELVEIGGAFRIPDVMAQSGAVLKEVGTTNKTHLYDYENAVTSNTAMVLKVHKSNYRISGFAEEVSVEELVGLGKKFGIPVMYDLGSGCLTDLRPLGIHDEPTVQQVVKAGADITTFSGDKLLGGPQAGVIVGKTDLIQLIQKHPLTRAVRVDKFTLSALEPIFMMYADMEKAKSEIPVLRMLFASEEALKIRARRLATALKQSGVDAEVMINKDRSKAGGGSIPEVEFVTWTVSVLPRTLSVNALEERLRKRPLPVIGRIQNDRFILDVRTIRTSHIAHIAEAVKDSLA